MRAIGFSEFGGPEVLHLIDRREQLPDPGEVRIRVRAATVNPTDTMARAGLRQSLMAAATPPYVPGMEAAGTIDAVGEGSQWAVGDDVMAMIVPFGPRGGAYAEQVVVPADQVVRMPAGLDAVAAATLPMNGLTAALAIEAMDLPAGAVVAVTGAAGALGGYVVQLARAAGLRVVADASEADEELVHELGAHEIVRRGPDVAKNIRAVVPAGVAGLVDASVQHGQVAPAIADRGVMVLAREWDGDPGRGIRKEYRLVTRSAGRSDLLELVRRRAEEGALVPRVARTFPAEDVVAAHRALEAGGTRGRLVLTF